MAKRETSYISVKILDMTDETIKATNHLCGIYMYMFRVFIQSLKKMTAFSTVKENIAKATIKTLLFSGNGF